MGSFFSSMEDVPSRPVARVDAEDVCDLDVEANYPTATDTDGSDTSDTSSDSNSSDEDSSDSYNSSDSLPLTELENEIYRGAFLDKKEDPYTVTRRGQLGARDFDYEITCRR
ncbi:unnamed protein product [Caenorhabditis auriculariae]|uniref:Uncharacterized protein n=1 Tax=Caenorhabditis auriculariae TaxID=2777116 RepID=A0A8S1H265_9PELO|nr:unnamed protein product [Caenorhabditis auriculariae]